MLAIRKIWLSKFKKGCQQHRKKLSFFFLLGIKCFRVCDFFYLST